jgi:perosamine synthetase
MTNYQNQLLQIIKKTYSNQDFIPLHVPKMGDLEKKYLGECVDSTFVSTSGQFVGEFEAKIAQICGMQYGIATTNGTSALHAALYVAGVKPGDEVLTQAVTFVATANAITYCSAHPVFIDCEWETLALCPVKLEEFLSLHTEIRNDGFCYNKKTNRRISACVPMHVYGHPFKAELIASTCQKHNIVLIEDSAEALGSLDNHVHVGKHGLASIISFNGNKIITTGGGGMILTNDQSYAKKLKHITTTARLPHSWEFEHDSLGFNYRLPNLNAALGVAQVSQFDNFLKIKREIAKNYEEEFSHFQEIRFLKERSNTKANYWLNCIFFKNEIEKNEFLNLSNSNGVMTRPLWKLLSSLEMYKNCERTNLETSEEIYRRLVNIPSSII